MQHIDETYRNAFEEVESELPQGAWDELEAHLEKKTRRRFIFWLCLTLLFGVFGSGLYLSQNALRSKKQDGDFTPNVVLLPKSDSTNVSNTRLTRPIVNSREMTQKRKRKSTVFNKKEPSELALLDNNILNISDEKPNDIVSNTVMETYKPLKNNNLSAISLVNILAPKPLSFMDKKIKKQTDCYEFNTQKRQTRYTFVDAYFGFDYVQKNLSSTNGGKSHLLNNRLNHEHFKNAYTGGVRVGHMRANFGLSLGVQFSHLVERLESIKNRSEFTNIKIEKITNTAGQVIRLDTVITTVIGKEVSVYHNRYTTFNIPIQASHQWQVKHWGIGVTAGPILNLKFNKYGTLINENKQLVDFDNSSSIFKPRLNINWSGSVSFTRQLTKHLYFLAEPTFYYQPQSITQATYALSQRYSRAGLYLGLRVKM